MADEVDAALEAAAKEAHEARRVHHPLFGLVDFNNHVDSEHYYSTARFGRDLYFRLSETKNGKFRVNPGMEGASRAVIWIEFPTKVGDTPKEAFANMLEASRALEHPQAKTFAELLVLLKMSPDQRREREIEALRKKQVGLEEELAYTKKKIEQLTPQETHVIEEPTPQIG